MLCSRNERVGIKEDCVKGKEDIWDIRLDTVERGHWVYERLKTKDRRRKDTTVTNKKAR